MQVTDDGGAARGDRRQPGSQIQRIGAARVKGLKAWAAVEDGFGVIFPQSCCQPGAGPGVKLGSARVHGGPGE